ncbi:electron transfer flavoprotein subunit alpha/FixB family protein [Actinomyces mediterranea]|uniref:electron transfer flavoprotein subunit alpha/FixB family protein n=1 Tax=Actinomyces mediterranea TaxID=1871028 RepID=UPI000970F982|nr:electron transfer flavoprotein subunit alpha/FixB family protein [Actinomyces mediterranea]
MTDTTNAPLLVLVDHSGSDADGWTLTPASAQILTLARTLSTAPVTAISLTGAPDLDALARFGAATVLTPALPDAAPRVSAVVADAVAACLDTDSFRALLIVSTYRGREVASRIATLTDSGVVADAVCVEIVDGTVVATTTALAGTWSTRIRVQGRLPVITVRPGSVDEANAASIAAPRVQSVAVCPSAEAAAVAVVSSSALDSDGRVPLTDASTVVVAGRGVGGDMAIAEQLADAFDAAVGATRVVCDEGWATRSLQIGQTGVSVSPNVYIGLGVSGAIHHTVGMQSAQHIVAVCDDPDAPIFEIADFGVVGDIFEVVPAALEAIAEARA